MYPELEFLYGKFRLIARGGLAVIILAIALVAVVLALCLPQVAGM